MKRFQFIYLVALILIPISLWILPSDFFDETGIVMCFSRIFFGIECLGCGMTRAVMHFHHFDFKMALFFNKGVLFIYPLLVWFWYRQVTRTAKKIGFFRNA